MYDDYNDLHDLQDKIEGMNWNTLQAAMISSLTTYFLSDNLTSPNTTSNQWNILFIEYKCCGVRSIHGTTNDFDITPWCTTSGSCQITNSQIPKTCCLGVTMEDYQSASNECHAQVIPQTYNNKGCYKALMDISIEERDKHKIKIEQVLCEGMKVLIAMVYMPDF
ncbi:uncharacterized protein LOC134254042 [Saccostrea cucullata]|uniref:uncharacterized protein LOC134254042 n=1 Tax=Saccostrea cuccullata TaxID=36930 RepID=UPI002ED57CD2